MLRNINIALGPVCFISDRKTNRHVTITITSEDNPDFQTTEIINESDFQSNFSILMDKAKKEFLKEYKNRKKLKGDQI